MKLYRTSDGPFLEHGDGRYRVPESDWDALLAHQDLYGYLLAVAADARGSEDFSAARILAPIGSQELWAAGVTYHRSRDARVAESRDAGGGDLYDRVYRAERPELFFKATASRIAGPGEAVRIRRDAQWSVPEPELTLVVAPGGNIIGFTIGNDMSSRDIEGENPLYLPQAKIYDRCAALGPCVLVANQLLSPATVIRMDIERAGAVAFSGVTTLAQLRRRPGELVEYLFRDNRFASGVYLMTGTGIIPPDCFTLAAGDRIRIGIDAIGTLENVVVQGVP
ncbi:MAG TPA: fumarylacetoacetate hydrolase family protein [Steroidobacteraceae bacterium]|nr:fumarylacetoacetate hydrolase family protein [Steroidobacteraceae bacterium]